MQLVEQPDGRRTIGPVVDEAQLPAVVELAPHRLDQRGQDLGRGVVDGHHDADQWPVYKPRRAPCEHRSATVVVVMHLAPERITGGFGPGHVRDQRPLPRQLCRPEHLSCEAFVDVAVRGERTRDRAGTAGESHRPTGVDLDRRRDTELPHGRSQVVGRAHDPRDARASCAFTCSQRVEHGRATGHLRGFERLGPVRVRKRGQPIDPQLVGRGVGDEIGGDHEPGAGARERAPHLEPRLLDRHSGVGGVGHAELRLGDQHSDGARPGKLAEAAPPPAQGRGVGDDDRDRIACGIVAHVAPVVR
jgi:hypothetical protein